MYSRKNLEAMSVDELRKLAVNYNVKIEKKTKADLVLSIYMKSRAKPKKKLEILQADAGKHINKMFNPVKNEAINPVTMEQPEMEDMNKTLIIITNETNKTYVILDEFLELTTYSTNRFYEIKWTKVNGKFEKFIDRDRVYVNISLPFNAIVRESDIMKINPGGLQVCFLEKTNIKMGELISQDVANRQGSLVGAHHGGEWLYTLVKQERGA